MGPVVGRPYVVIMVGRHFLWRDLKYGPLFVSSGLKQCLGGFIRIPSWEPMLEDSRIYIGLCTYTRT